MMSSNDGSSAKRSKSKQSSHHHHHHHHHTHHRRSRRHNHRLNSDLYEDDDDDRRDAWTKRPLSPDSLWKELQLQRFLKNKMRRNMQAKAKVVDGKGRLVTLAERIIRFKLYDTADGNTAEGEPSTSTADESTVPRPDKKRSLANLLHEYIQQRHAESVIGSELLEEISEAKTALNDNEYKRALSAKKEVASRASSLSLGDSATNYNAKTNALLKGGGPDDADNRQSIESDVQRGKVVRGVLDANGGGEISRSLGTIGVIQERNDTPGEKNDSRKVDIDIVIHKMDDHTDISNAKRDSTEGNTEKQSGLEPTPVDSEGMHGEGKSKLSTPDHETDDIPVKCDNEVCDPENDNGQWKTIVLIEDIGHVPESTSSDKEETNPGRNELGTTISGETSRQEERISDAEKAAICDNDNKESEKDSAIESFDFYDQPDAGADEANPDFKTRRAYQFTALRMDRSYTLPELVLADYTGIFSSRDHLTNRQRGRKVTVVSSLKGDNTTVTSHLLPNVKSCLPSHWAPSVHSEEVGVETETCLVESDNAQNAPTCSQEDAIDNGLEGSDLTPKVSESRGSVDTVLDLSSDEDDTSGFPRTISNALVTPEGRRLVCSLTSSRYNDTIGEIPSEDLTDREKRVVGLYNELQCYSMLQRSRHTIAIAMNSKPSGTADLHIEWGTFNQRAPTGRPTPRNLERLKPVGKQISSPTSLPGDDLHTHRSPHLPDSLPPSECHPQLHKIPPEFIYVRDLSFSQYVSKVLARRKISPYFEEAPFKNSKPLGSTSHCPQFLQQGWRRNGLDGNSMQKESRPSDGARRNTSNLPRIDSNNPVCLVNSDLPKDSIPGEGERVKSDNKVKLKSRGKLALERLKKRLKLPQIQP